MSLGSEGFQKKRKLFLLDVGDALRLTLPLGAEIPQQTVAVIIPQVAKHHKRDKLHFTIDALASQPIHIMGEL